MAGIPDLSQKLSQLLFMALDHGVDSVREGGPLIPFLMSSEGEKISMQRFASDQLEEATSLGRQHAAGLPRSVRLAAFVYDGYVTVGAKKSDAVMVEAYERGMPQAVVFAQRYQPASGDTKLELIGNAAYVGTTKPLFR